MALTAVLSGRFSPVAGAVELLTVAVGDVIVGLGSAVGLLRHGIPLRIGRCWSGAVSAARSARRELLRAERSALLSLLRDCVISATVAPMIAAYAARPGWT